MGGIRGGLGGFLPKKTAAKSIRQRHHTGPMYNRRKVFQFRKGTINYIERSVAYRLGRHPTTEHHLFAYLPGDATALRWILPLNTIHDWMMVIHGRGSNRRRVDKLRCVEARGRRHQLGGKPETFVCYRCGYPVRSNLQVIRDDNLTGGCAIDAISALCEMDRKQMCNSFVFNYAMRERRKRNFSDPPSRGFVECWLVFVARTSQCVHPLISRPSQINLQKKQRHEQLMERKLILERHTHLH